MSAYIFKTQFEDNDGNIHWMHTSADIAYFNGLTTTLLKDAGSVDAAIRSIDRLLSDCVTVKNFYATIGTVFQGTEAPYTQTINVDGILPSDDPFVGLVVSDNPATGKEQEKHFGRVSRITTGAGYITVYCNDKKPEVSLNIKLVAFRNNA